MSIYSAMDPADVAQNSFGTSDAFCHMIGHAMGVKMNGDAMSPMTPTPPLINSSGFISSPSGPTEDSNSLDMDGMYDNLAPNMNWIPNNMDLYLECNEDDGNVRNNQSSGMEFDGSRPFNIPAGNKMSYKVSFPDKGGKGKKDDNVERFSCDMCGAKSFSRESLLKDHKARIHGIRDLFACPWCPYMGQLNRHLTKHIKRKHAQEAGVVVKKRIPKTEGAVNGQSTPKPKSKSKAKKADSAPKTNALPEDMMDTQEDCPQQDCPQQPEHPTPHPMMLPQQQLTPPGGQQASPQGPFDPQRMGFQNRMTPPAAPTAPDQFTTPQKRPPEYFGSPHQMIRSDGNAMPPDSTPRPPFGGHFDPRQGGFPQQMHMGQMGQQNRMMGYESRQETPQQPMMGYGAQGPAMYPRPVRPVYPGSQMMAMQQPPMQMPHFGNQHQMAQSMSQPVPQHLIANQTAQPASYPPHMPANHGGTGYFNPQGGTSVAPAATFPHPGSQHCINPFEQQANPHDPMARISPMPATSSLMPNDIRRPNAAQFNVPSSNPATPNIGKPQASKAQEFGMQHSVSSIVTPASQSRSEPMVVNPKPGSMVQSYMSPVPQGNVSCAVSQPPRNNVGINSVNGPAPGYNIAAVGSNIQQSNMERSHLEFSQKVNDSQQSVAHADSNAKTNEVLKPQSSMMETLTHITVQDAAANSKMSSMSMTMSGAENNDSRSAPMRQLPSDTPESQVVSTVGSCEPPSSLTCLSPASELAITKHPNPYNHINADVANHVNMVNGVPESKSTEQVVHEPKAWSDVQELSDFKGKGQNQEETPMNEPLGEIVSNEPEELVSDHREAVVSSAALESQDTGSEGSEGDEMNSESEGHNTPNSNDILNMEAEQSQAHSTISNDSTEKLDAHSSDSDQHSSRSPSFDDANSHSMSLGSTMPDNESLSTCSDDGISGDNQNQASSGNVDEEMSENQNQKDAAKKATSRYECSICNKQFGNRTGLYSHTKITHPTAKPFTCSKENCNQTFKTSSACNEHQATVHSPKVFKCSEAGCTKAYAIERDLRAHQKLHTGIHKCHVKKKGKICGKTFRDKYNLGIHIKTHTGEKNLSCSYCSYACIQKTSLNHHLRTKHSNEVTEEDLQ